MAGDRLAALRAQQQIPAAEEGQAGYEMTGLAGATANGNEGSMPLFYAEVTTVQGAVKQYDVNISRIAELQTRSLSALDESSNRQNQNQLDSLVAETRTLGNECRQQIQRLAAWPVRPRDIETRNNQVGVVKTTFMDALQRYQKVEQQYRDKQRERVARQFKIVKPDATPEETTAVLDEAAGGSTQIFAAALSSSNASSQARSAQQAAQERHKDLQRIEQTLSELVQLLNDMATLVLQQDDTINGIQAKAVEIEEDTKEGHKNLVQAVVHAANARRGRQVCFGVFLIIVLALALGLGLHYGLPHIDHSSSS